ncbi:transposase, partial [uncultured Cardiobacterium sp.]
MQNSKTAPIAEVAARHRISPNALATWKKQPQPKGSRRSTPRL